MIVCNVSASNSTIDAVFILVTISVSGSTGQIKRLTADFKTGFTSVETKNPDETGTW